ncbi:hypothetical protein M9H77_27314 [Catharanthus roseus]|uniref:Uncharacterized protein n=1 Tax=Catharanthus roseus TaxID=4058 RepID=A0ACC0AD60_CATRO|nr:hypothetical protein M9H77_27314 [Catharanthus roseus]
MARGTVRTLAGVVGETRRSICTIRVVHSTASAKGTVGRYAIRRVLGKLMFEAAGGSNKGHIYGFGSQSTTITGERQGGSSNSSPIMSESSIAANKSFIEREKRL